MITLRVLAGLLLLVISGAACGASEAAHTASAPPVPTVLPTSTAPVAAAAPTGAPAQANTIPLRIGTHTLEVELATTSAQRQRGLMYREDMPENGGMLFVFPNTRPLSFWMRNTPLPLSIAFLDEEKRIINIAQMQPFTTRSHQSAQPARYALEVHQGWFAEHGIEAGDVCLFHLPPDIVIE
jgi:hypothetical protein